MKTMVILGMHRSATSLVAKGLNNEIFMGDNLLKPRPCNPKGFFEERTFVKLNDRILTAAGGSWDNPPARESILQQTQFDAEIKTLVQTAIAKATKKGYEFWGWKDPRSALTIELFLPHLPNPHFVVCYRNPIDVAKSLKARDPKMSIEKGLALTREYNKRIRDFIDTQYA